MRVAFVYDRVNKIGGAERVLQALHEIWPAAPLFTAVYNRNSAPWASEFDVKPSFIQKFPFAKKHHEFYAWLTPFAFESFNFNNFDVVISITSAEAKGIITKPETLHICYCLTPTRYLWSGYYQYLNKNGFGHASGLAKFAFKLLAPKLRKWDFVAGQRPEFYLSISKAVKKRIKKYYRHDSEIIYPPVEVEKFKPENEKKGEYFLIVSRLVPYKNIRVAVKAFNKTGLPLKIIGTGIMKKRLKRQAKNNIEFLGQLTDDHLIYYYQSCRALVMPQEEDFGITAVEAQAAGKPVIAYKKGGALDTVIAGKTGVFFAEQQSNSLIEALEKFEKGAFKAKDCLENAQKFDKNKFKKEFKKFVETKWQTKKKLM